MNVLRGCCHAHHQNGDTGEIRLKELQELARAKLIRSSTRWQDNVTANLWPHAIWNAYVAVKNTPSFNTQKGDAPPIDLLSGTKILSNPKHWKPFCLPTYVCRTSSRDKDRSTNGTLIQAGNNFGLCRLCWVERLDTLPVLCSISCSIVWHIKNITTRSMWHVWAGFVAQRETSQQGYKPKPAKDPTRLVAPTIQNCHQEQRREKGVRKVKGTGSDDQSPDQEGTSCSKRRGRQPTDTLKQRWCFGRRCQKQWSKWRPGQAKKPGLHHNWWKQSEQRNRNSQS